jgi:hypothetical protein
VSIKHAFDEPLTYDKPIVYEKKHNLYDFNSLKNVEGIFAYNFMQHSNVDFKTAFLIRNGRKPNEHDIEFQNTLKNTNIHENAGYITLHWFIYTCQNIMLEYPLLQPPTKEIIRISEKTFGHKIPESYIYQIDHIIRKRKYKIKHDKIHALNIWQLMITVQSLKLNKIKINDTSIVSVFSKIYKREPTEKEIQCCKNLTLTSYERNIHEIESTVEINEIELYTKRSNKYHRYKCERRAGRS